jgi:hypothetical protein
MAVKTKAQILSEISTLLADNTSGDISANDVRTVVNDITDSYEDLITAGTTSQYWRGDKTWQTLSTNYLIYSVKILQEGTTAPSITIAKNTLGFVPTWSRISTGIYKITNCPANWTSKQILSFNSPFDYRGPNYQITAYYDLENNEYFIKTYLSGTLDDDIMGDGDGFYLPSLEIHVY